MDAVFTLWSSPNQKPLGGFLDEPTFYIFSSLAVHRAQRFFDRAVLHTNTKGAEFVDRLGIPFDVVRVTHDSLDSLDPKLWAWSKMKTYWLQDAPFCHLDLDVILHQKPRFKGGAMFQCMEPIGKYRYPLQGLKAFKKYGPWPELLNQNPQAGYNVGVTITDDLPMVKDWCLLAQELAGSTTIYEVPAPNHFFEQYGVACAIAKHDTRTDVIIQQRDLSRQLEHPVMSHYWGGLKRNKRHIAALRSKLHKEVPETVTHFKTLFGK